MHPVIPGIQNISEILNGGRVTDLETERGETGELEC